MQYEVLKSRL